ncbi:MAG: hypothetical protein EOP59_03375 [Sphingomonadales bacterium]|nr:MAG: hypothetical protein EOP59_03375 [Sphingomonadales bacterium]
MLVMSLVLMLAPTEYPAFDADRAASLCEVKRAERDMTILYEDNASCVADQRADHRYFTVIAANADPAFAPAFARCALTWTKDGTTDWGMMEYCARTNIDGKRDFTALRADTKNLLRTSVNKCVADETEDGAPDWDSIASCARDQVGGHRDLALFRRAASTATERQGIDLCRMQAVDAEDKVVDWANAVRCAARIRIY